MNPENFRRIAARLTAACAICCLALSGTACRSVSDTPPNLILVTIDTLRADRVGAYGNRDGLTPNLDALAAEGVVFERALAPITTTHPSHASMMTGLYARFHGVLWNGHQLVPEAVTLAELLKDAGYSTGAFVSYPAMLFRARLDQGFDAVSDTERPRGKRYYRACFDTNTLAIEWLRSLAGGPMFLWVHYFEPHTPYRLQSYSVSKFATDGYSGPLAQGTEGLQPKIRAAARKATKSSPRELEALRTLYDGEVQAADRCLGDLLDALENRSLLNGAVVMATSDHGEGLGEHGRWSHGPYLWNSVLQVPWIVWDSRRTDPRRVAERVGLVDLAPTLLETAGVEIPTGIHGRTLIPALRGEKLSTRPYFAEARPVHAALEDRRPRFKKRLAVFVDQFKQTTDRGRRRRLYDLSKDPEELAPLAPRNFASVAGRLGELANGFLATEAGTSASLLDDVDLDELRTLGYL